MPHLQGPQKLSLAHVKRAGLEKEKGGSIIISLARSLTSGTYKKDPKEAVRVRCYRNVRRFILRKRCLHFHCCCCCCAYAKPSAYAQKCVQRASLTRNATRAECVRVTRRERCKLAYGFPLRWQKEITSRVRYVSRIKDLNSHVDT